MSRHAPGCSWFREAVCSCGAAKQPSPAGEGAQERNPEWLRRWLTGERVGCSTGIAEDEPTYGYDGPDSNGYFSVPVPDVFMSRLVQHAKAYAERNGLRMGKALSPERTALVERLERRVKRGFHVTDVDVADLLREAAAALRKEPGEAR